MIGAKLTCVGLVGSSLAKRANEGFLRWTLGGSSSAVEQSAVRALVLLLS